MTEFDSFTDTLRYKPEDNNNRLVFADWLDEHDRPEPAAALRTWAKVTASLPPVYERRPSYFHTSMARTENDVPAVAARAVELFLVRAVFRRLYNRSVREYLTEDELYRVERRALGMPIEYDPKPINRLSQRIGLITGGFMSGPADQIGVFQLCAMFHRKLDGGDFGRTGWFGTVVNALTAVEMCDARSVALGRTNRRASLSRHETWLWRGYLAASRALEPTAT